MPLYDLTKLRFTAPYFSAIDCILNKDEYKNKAIYCSSELTSGFLLYSEMRRLQISDRSELKLKLGEDWFRKNIFEVNSRSANSFADSVRRRQTDGTLVITPAPLYVPEWGQPEYLAFWEEIVRTRVKAVWFNNNWEYSDGCTLEFVIATQNNLPRFDAEGKQISASAAVIAIEKAIAEFDEEFDTTKLHQNLEHLRSSMEVTSSMPLSTPNAAPKANLTS
jgi:hypothetical protein